MESARGCLRLGVKALDESILSYYPLQRSLDNYMDPPRESSMDEEALNLSIRKFLKAVGINSQREIEHAVTKAIAAGAIKGTESFPAKMTLEVAGLSVNFTFNGDIALQ
jgi:hypothetical protein